MKRKGTESQQKDVRVEKRALGRNVPGLVIFGALRAILLHQAPVGQQ